MTNIPLPSEHVKYRFPPTLPSFFPFAASSSTPTHFPAAKEVCPTKRMIPGPAATVTRVLSLSTAGGVEVLAAMLGWESRRGGVVRAKGWAPCSLKTRRTLGLAESGES